MRCVFRPDWTITPAVLRPTSVQGHERWWVHGARGFGGVQLWRLTSDRPRPPHQAVERYARYFRREFHYSFVLYDADEPYDVAETQAWLWTTMEADLAAHAVLGAACCRWRTYTNLHEAFWALQWVWLHPFARHQGVFTQAWPILLEQYGALHLEPPLSGTMQRIVAGRPAQTLYTTTGTPVVLYVPTPTEQKEVV